MLRGGLFDAPRRIDEPELIDDVNQSHEELRASMSDVRRLNRYFGGAAVVTSQVRRWLRGTAGCAHCISLLDVATGSADIPAYLLRTARAKSLMLRIVGLDRSAPILRCARELVHRHDPIRLVQSCAFPLPFGARAFDYALCALAFHHLGFDGSVAALAEMERVTTRGWLVSDIRRSWSAWYLISAILALMGANRLTRHDGPASVLRAFTVDEYRAMPQALGLRPGVDFIVRRRPFYRVAIIRDKDTDR